jgi:hypothetical protein
VNKPPKGAVLKSSRRFGTERLGNPVPRVQAGMDNGDERTVTAVIKCREVAYTLRKAVN